MFNIFSIMDSKGQTLFELDMLTVPYEQQQQEVQNAVDSLMNIADLEHEFDEVPEPIIVTFINRDKDGVETYLPYFIATPIDGSNSWFIDLLTPGNILEIAFKN